MKAHLPSSRRRELLSSALPGIVDIYHRHDSAPRLLTNMLGGKGAHLAEMAGVLGLPVPPGFTITTAACADALDTGDYGAIMVEVDAAIERLERQTGHRFGDMEDPLLVSVRSGAPSSMPGMMDTVLNVGATPQTVIGLAWQSSNDDFAWDCYARLVAMYAKSVLGFADDIGAVTSRIAGEHERLVDRIPALAAFAARWAPVPTDPRAQLEGAIRAVVASWHSDRARAYRRIENIPEWPCTAVTVQAMVFGNRGMDSGSGVAFTRDPATGAPGLVGDWLPNAQGEDVVAGTHLTRTISDLGSTLPHAAAELQRAASVLERHYADMCDIEFTVEHGRLFLLQVRVGKRSPRAALRIAIDLANDPAFALDRRGAVERVANLLMDPPRDNPPLASLAGGVKLHRGIGVSPGIGVGRACFDSDAVVELSEAGEPAVLVRRETSPSDVHGMAAAAAILTAAGGTMSHAAVVARGWGKPAVVGMAGLRFEESAVTINGEPLRLGDWLSVDGTTGDVALTRIDAGHEPVAEVKVLMDWATEAGIDIPSASEIVHELPDAVEAEMPIDIEQALLVLLSIKGVTPLPELAAALMSSVETIEAAARPDLVEAVKRGYRLTSTGAGQAAAHIAAMRAEHAADAALLLDGFDDVNSDLKATITSWQLRDDGRTPNDHSDASYDAAVIARLRIVHDKLERWLGGLSVSSALMTLFGRRLERAILRIEAGETAWLLSPRVDSYHAVWFELHEYLIRLAGASRVEEAAAGRAA